MKGDGLRFGNRVEGQSGHNAEVSATGPAQRPIEIMVQAGITGDHGAIGENDLRTGQAVAAQAVRSAEYSEPAAQGEARNTYCRAAPSRDGGAVIMEDSIDLSELGTTPDRGKIIIHRDRIHESGLE
jgi:hypothetical protein